MFLILVSLSTACAAVDIRLDFSQAEVVTGEMVEVEFNVNASSLQELSTQTLQNTTIDQKIYVRSISPFVKQEGLENYTAEGEIIFIKDPKANEVQGMLKDSPVRFHWNNVHVEVIEAPKDYVLADFTIPTPRNLALWILILVLLIGTGLGLLKLRSHIDRKNSLRNQRRAIRDQVLSCTNYEDVVALWKNKSDLLRHFPHLEKPFVRLEGVLFKYQFKASQTYEEKQTVLRAYKDFTQDIQGGFSGV